MRSSGRAIHIDDHELRELSQDLSHAPLRVRLNAGEAVRQTGRAIEREMRVDATGHEGNVFGRPGTQFEIGLEQHVSSEMLDPLTTEAGIENKGSGSLGHIVAFGSIKNAPAYDPYAGPDRAIRASDDRFADAAEDAAFGRRGHAG